MELGVKLFDAAGQSYNGSAELEVVISGAIIVDSHYQIYKRHKQTRDVAIREVIQNGDAPRELMATASTGVREAVLHRASYSFFSGPYNVR